MSTRNYLKLELFFIALVLFNCEQEDDSIKPEPTFDYENPFYQQQIVNLSEIPEIERSIRSTYPSIFRNTNISNSTASSTSASNTTIIDVDHILEIVDTLNNKNYSIRFRFNDTPLSEFYNLVIGKDTLGFTTEPFVLKYKCDASQLDQYISNDFDFSYFKGTMELHKYTDYFQEGSLTTTIGGDEINCPKDFDEVGDPIPCETTPVDPVGSGGGSSDDGSGITGGPLDSDFGVDSDASDDLAWICFHRLQSHPDPSYCNDPDAGGFWVVNTSAPPQESGEIHNESGIKVDECPDCDISSPTGIGINPIPMETVRTALKSNLILSRDGIAFIGHSDNNRAVIQVYYYIEPYLELNVAISPEAKAFAEQAIEFLASNIQYSFEQYENWFSPFNAELETNPTIVNSNLIIFDTPLTQQTLPTFTAFLTNFPKRGTIGNYSPMSTTDAYTIAGGSLLNSHINQNAQYNNACAIRASRGLLYSGIQIPILKYNGSQRTQKGGDGKNYILDAVSFNKYMIAKFGETSVKLEGADANDPVKVAAFLNGKNGIYVIVNSNTRTAGYSGHCDVIINGKCISNAYTTPEGGVKSIRIWELN